MYSLAMDHLHANLKQLLETGRISVGRLASICDMQQPTLFRILAHPEREPRTKTIEPIAMLLGVSVTDLMSTDLRAAIAARGPYPWQQLSKPFLRPEPGSAQEKVPLLSVPMIAVADPNESGAEIEETEHGTGQIFARETGHPGSALDRALSELRSRPVLPSQTPKAADYARSGGILSGLGDGREPNRDPEATWAWFQARSASFAEAMRDSRAQSAIERQAFLRSIWGGEAPQVQTGVKLHKVTKLVDWLSEFTAATFISTLSSPPPSKWRQSQSTPTNWNPIRESLALERAILRMALISATTKLRSCMVFALIGKDTSVAGGEQRHWEATALGVDLLFVRSGTEAAELLRTIESQYEESSRVSDEIVDPELDP